MHGNGISCAECLENSECEAGLELCFVGECQNRAQVSIQAVRNGTGTTIRWATVTFLKPAIGSEAAGFFIQAEQWGPALFVSVDPSSLSPVPVVGDRVWFDVASTGLVGGARHVTAVTNWQIMSSGNPVQPLVAEIGSDPYLTAASLESRLVSFTGALGPISVTPDGYSTAPMTTAVWGPTAAIQLRLPEVLQDALNLAEGCTITLARAPVWLSGTTAYPSVYAPDDLSSVSCPAPVSRTFSESP